jgi:hypothetical protein
MVSASFKPTLQAGSLLKWSLTRAEETLIFALF